MSYFDNFDDRFLNKLKKNKNDNKFINIFF
jgi:hypothetical protein